MSFCLILLSAGKSSRFGSNLAKPYQKIGAKTLLEINLNKINSHKLIKKVIVAYNRKDKKLINSLKLKNVHLIPGGNTRQDSTFKALKYAKKFKGITKVLIHDVARPNFSKNLLKSIINKGKKYRSVIPILKISDAIKQKHNDNIVARIRDNFFITQTPQCFDFKEIYKLHIVNKYKYIDDDFSLLKDFKNIKLINGEKNNFKITEENDLQNLKNIYKSKVSLGIGFDVHRLVSKKKLYLGGVKIKSKLGTLGHSDGDPVLHAITDSIMGACKLGDIGTRFSDKKNENKNVRSTKFLKAILNDINDKGFFINNIDLNIITQYPKIKKYKNKIMENICKICEIPKNKINIKGKTTEKLGVIGKEKAIACEVITSVINYG